MTMQQVRRTFLDIPADVRERIYLAAGLTEGTNIHLRKRRPSFTSNPENPFRLTYNLLQTCKTIYAQVKSILYARNSIVVCHENVEGGLEILRGLSQEQCRSLRHLFVHLHVDGSLHDEYGAYELSSPALSHEKIAAWQATARHILSRVEIGTLTLHLISDTGDSQETRAVCEPLLDFPGKLKDCDLRLGSRLQNPLSALALETVRRIRGDDPDMWNRPFRFLHLPFEIRRQVLEYTDLVTPYNQVQWSSNKGFHAVFIISRCAHLDDEKSDIHYACKMRFCAPPSYYETGSFCRSRRSAYSSSCHCWSPPEAFMSVSQAMYQDAIDVFYSCNRIIIMPSGGIEPSVCSRYSLSRLDASRFITRYMWPETLHRLRSLELVFPFLDRASCPDTSSPLYLDWCFAVDHLKAHANLAQLTVIVHMSLQASSPWPSLFKLSHWAAWPGLSAPARLLTPLQALRQMKRFFVHLEWSWHWTPEHLACMRVCEHLRYEYEAVDPETFAERAIIIGDKNDEHRHDLAVEMESWLEQTVMGNEYDSLIMGKAEEKKSEWMKIDLCKFLYP
ncbi:hypothetical protein F4818DRAFT_37923 [Hypoxylon cercidicola]|nr:hypothetical protein F4818DRAFT_37923 [Hypoxylon cercidicola]